MEVGSMRSAKVHRLVPNLLLLWLCSISVVKGEWGEWGACAVTCGTGQRTREGCKKEVKPGKTCPPGQVTTQTEVCSTASCGVSSLVAQADDCFTKPVGVSDQAKIPDNHITASSQYGDNYKPAYGRLNGDRGDGWCAKKKDKDDWLQVDLGTTFQVCAVATQGDIDGDEWATHFKLSYSSDGNVWTPYKDANGVEVEFHRQGDSNTVDQHRLSVPVSARYFRFYPTKQHKWNCLRVELYEAQYSSSVALTSSSQKKTSFVPITSPLAKPSISALTSSSEAMTSDSSSVFPMSSTSPSSTAQLSSSLTLASSSQKKTSFVPITSPLAKPSISALMSSSETMTSDFSSEILMSSTSPSPTAQPSSFLALTSSSQKKTSSVSITSSLAKLSTSDSSSVILMLSTSPSSTAQPSSLLAMTSSSQGKTSSVALTPPLAKSSPSQSMSSAVMMASGSSSVILMSPAKSIHWGSIASFASLNSGNNKDDPSSRQAYFHTAEENWILLNHVIKDIWTPSEITCAMFCLRDQNCQSINFKFTAKDSIQVKNTNTKQYPNCQLNSAKHLANPMDFFPRKGYRYYYFT
ncbi:uncharacterized protein LOC144643648 isoform X1 [Oculina patagonica]